MTALSPTFAELLLDIHHAIFHHLDDRDIISLLTLSRTLRVIGLVTVITRYRHSRLELEDHVKFSSSSHAELYANLMSITTLTCRVSVQNPLAGNNELMHVLRCILAPLSCLVAVTTTMKHHNVFQFINIREIGILDYMPSFFACPGTHCFPQSTRSAESTGLRLTIHSLSLIDTDHSYGQPSTTF
ncbi:hypothetical protein Hypma_004978 [Hypsizygus marmoreus]|uniref:F-box domain-containing protein n=1 Tax=Hypsizygus marmoreus TaxID=39966 RepID=A0A369K7M8_HYPMA|nr:hypothetical protein Hypma_004978 [Hypsizygus marmoreus]